MTADRPPPIPSRKQKPLSRIGTSIYAGAGAGAGAAVTNAVVQDDEGDDDDDDVSACAGNNPLE